MPERVNVPHRGWVGELLRAKPAPIPWSLAVLTAVAIVVPVSIGMATDNLGAGILTSMGALIASIADGGGVARARVQNILTVAIAAALGILLGSAVFGNAIATIVVVTAAALISGLAGVISANASRAGLQFVLYAVVGSGISFGLGSIWLTPLFLLIGAAWRLGLTALTLIGRRRAHAPERTAVASVYRALAAQLDAIGTDGVDAARADSTAAMNSAYDMIVVARSRSAGREKRYRELMTLLNAATPLVEATVTVVRGRVALDPSWPNALRSFAHSIESESAPVELPPADRSTPGRAALSSAMRTVRALLGGEEPATMTVPIQRPVGDLLPHLPMRDRLAAVRDQLTGGAATWGAIVRLVLCVAVAEVLGAVLPIERPYWIILTVAVVMKPDFGSVFARAVQRGVGTIVGVLLGTLILVVLPYGPPLLVAMAVLAAAMPIVIRRNYGLFSTFLTPVIVILLELANRDDSGLVVARVLDTVIGCAIVILIGYLPWPSTWRGRQLIASRIADVTDDVARYLATALRPREKARASAEQHPAARPDRSSLRRSTYRHLSDLRTLVQQTLAEPPPVSTRAAAWWPEIVALERLTDAITSAAIRIQRGTPAPRPHSVDEVGRALTDLAASIREQRPPLARDLPEDEVLTGIVSELTTARAIATDP